MKRLTAVATLSVLAAALLLAAPCAGEEPAKPEDPGTGAEKPPEAAPPKDAPAGTDPAAPSKEAPPAEKPPEKPEAGKPGDKPAPERGPGMREREEAEPKPAAKGPDAVARIEPLRGGRNSYFHSLLGLPPMSSGLGLPPNTGTAFLSFEITRCSGVDEGGVVFDATHFEGVFGARYAVSEMVEFHGAVCGALLGGDVSVDWLGTPMVPEPRKEQARISRLLIGTKFNFLPLGKGAPDLWASLDFKIPGAEKDLADSGRPAVGLTLHLSQEIGPLWAHANLGWFLSDGQENFPPVAVSPYAQESIRTLRVICWGLALVLPVADRAGFVLQAVGNTNSFRDLPALNSDVHVLLLGARYAHGPLSAELSGGVGLSDASADWTARLEIGVLFGGR
jgi:hypothetical protein